MTNLNNILEAIDRGISNALDFNLDNYDSDSNDLYISKKKVNLDKADKEAEARYNFVKIVDKIRNSQHLTPEENSMFLIGQQLGCKYTIEDNRLELRFLIREYCNSHGWKSDLNWIDTKNVTDMTNLFRDTYFNGDISKWDTSNVITMDGMFSYTKDFNQPIGKWDVSNVKNMIGIFRDAKSFNQPIGSWDVSNIRSALCLFSGAASFNQDISNWKITCTSFDSWMFNRCPIEEKFKPHKQK